jgi:hypothetical protein
MKMRYQFLIAILLMLVCLLAGCSSTDIIPITTTVYNSTSTTNNITNNITNNYYTNVTINTTNNITNNITNNFTVSNLTIQSAINNSGNYNISINASNILNSYWSLLTISQVSNSIGNWSSDKTQVLSNISNANATANTKAKPGTCVVNTWATATTTSGVSCTQPTFTNISGTITDAQMSNQKLNLSGGNVTGKTTFNNITLRNSTGSLFCINLNSTMNGLTVTSGSC